MKAFLHLFILPAFFSFFITYVNLKIVDMNFSHLGKAAYAVVHHDRTPMPILTAFR
jgi:hypothetical protein